MINWFRTIAGMLLIAQLGSMQAVGASADPGNIYSALGAPAHRQVEVAWNRFYDTEGLADILKRLNNAFPNLTRLYQIGESYEGRPIWCLEVTNFDQGAPGRKPGMYIDGNIHGNEVQAGEVVAYTAWYLCENFGRAEAVTELLNERVFYLLPTINPDGRDHWFEEANNPHSSRTGKVPYDNDRDGRVDEDGYDDLNGDGSISMMRVNDPNGRWKPHPDYPEYFMVRADADERGEYRLFWSEGIDNDGDGELNEDEPGGYDPNRNWPYDWAPNYVQRGAHEFPASLPETRAVIEFVLDHPNIAGAQSYHNFGGMILRGPGVEGGVMNSADERVLREVAARGERILPFYRSLVIWKDLYTVYGGELDWFYGGRGIASFTNELWTLNNLFRDDDTGYTARGDFIRYVLMEEGAVEWEPYDHPDLGKVEIGGIKKNFWRVPPSFLLEEECHRNMAFTLYHAQQMPTLEWGEVTIEPLREGLVKVWVEVRNQGLIPTRLQQDVDNGIHRPDWVMLEGPSVNVLSGGIVQDALWGDVQAVAAKPHRIALETVPGLDARRVQFIVAGEGQATLTVDSVKGGVIEKTIDLDQ